MSGRGIRGWMGMRGSQEPTRRPVLRSSPATEGGRRNVFQSPDLPASPYLHFTARRPSAFSAHSARWGMSHGAANRSVKWSMVPSAASGSSRVDHEGDLGRRSVVPGGHQQGSNEDGDCAALRRRGGRGQPEPEGGDAAWRSAAERSAVLLHRLVSQPPHPRCATHPLRQPAQLTTILQVGPCSESELSAFSHALSYPQHRSR